MSIRMQYSLHFSYRIRGGLIHCVFVVLAALQITACKKHGEILGRSLSDASGDDTEFEQLSLAIKWSATDASQNATIFTITDANGKPYQASPSNVNFIEKIGTLNTSPEDGKFLSLGQSDGRLFPTIDLDLTFSNPAEKRFQWCHTKNPLAFGVTGNVRCYRQESEKGHFVSACIGASGHLLVDKDLLKCENLGIDGRGDYTFNFFDKAPGPGISIEALPVFRGLQSLCRTGSTSTTDSVIADPTNPRQCVCTDLATKVAKAYDLWQVANFFIKEKSPDINKAFLAICLEQQDIIPTPAPALPNIPPVGTAQLTTDLQININVCTRLQALGYSRGYDPKSQMCACSSAIAPLAPSNVNLNSVNLDSFLERCFALDIAKSYPEVCGRIGMKFVETTAKIPIDKGTCRSVSATPARDCPIFFARPKAEFIDKCLELTPKAAVSPQPNQPLPISPANKGLTP